MSSTSVRIRYRPVRIGWCIRNGEWADLQRALRLTHIFWGGKFNPLIPIEAACAERLIRRFRVDVLFGASDDAKIKSFIQGYKYLPWPFFEPALFTSSASGYVPNMLDISHLVSKIAESGRAEGPITSRFSQFSLVHWNPDDPLANVLLSTFGSYPTADEVKADYGSYVVETINGRLENLSVCETVPAYLLNSITPSALTTEDLNWDRIPYESNIGFYVGNANDFADIVNYWNLRACDLNVVFLDPDQMPRLIQWKNSQWEFIEQKQASRHTKKEVPVWSRSQEAVVKIGFPLESVSRFIMVADVDVIQGTLRPPLHYFNSKSVLGALSEPYGRPSLSIQLPDKPFQLGDEWSTEHFVVSLKPQVADVDDIYTFWSPYVSELNPWLGREFCLHARDARSEFDGVGVITKITAESLTLNSLKKVELAAKIFELAGIDAKPSLPGRLASRLISQLGGLQGCRVLKIAGVRHLIRKYGPLQQFDRTEAIRLIGNSDPVTGAPRFSDYEGLFIEQRDPSISKLKPDHAFLYLLDKQVFRVGLTIVCPVCELEFWLTLDDASSHTHCELCGNSFNLTRQLKDRAWTYRRSGLFGRENNQEGSIPVALTLQQLDTQINTWDHGLLLTNMLLKPAGANIQPCETDIFAAIPVGDRIDIAVGECKDAGGKITLDDAKKLAAVADAFPRSKFDAYIIFSKTAPFSPEEIEACRAAQNGGLRVIMFSDRELEPYFVYEKTAQQFDIQHSGVSLDAMARVTHDVFFKPKTKK